MPRERKDTLQLTFRVPTEWALRADKLADKISRPGKRASRTDALRAALERGLEALDAAK